MNCRHCGAQLEEGAVFCTQCGALAEAATDIQPLQQETAAGVKPKRKRVKTMIIISSCAVVVACAVLIPVLIEKAKASRYEAAFAMMEEGDAPEAMDEFAELGAYRDSESLIDTCRNMIDYEKARELKEAGDYTAAKSAFDSLATYKDSAALSQECQDIMDYDAAAALKDGGDTEKARDAFLALGGYSDAAELAQECQSCLDYDAAKKLMEAGNFEAAKAAFTKLTGFLRFFEPCRYLPVRA